MDVHSLETRIHPTALVAPGARLGRGIVVGPFALIEDGVTIADGCVIGPRVTLYPGTEIGPRCRLHANVVLGDLPQDLNFRGGDSWVRIGADCILREGVTVNRGTAPGTTTEIGSECLLMAHSHVGHNARLGNGVILANGALLAGYSEIGDRAFVSGNCLIHQFTRVGRLAMMAGGSAAQMDVPPFCITRSLTVNTVIGLNVIGLRRAGIGSDERQAIKNAFDLIYRRGLGISRALELISDGPMTDCVRELHDFIRASKRGICKFIRDPRESDTERPPLAA
jgi:UDP-N-acetylglucosamine acyltransferase